jgi:hypothetical protein
MIAKLYPEKIVIDVDARLHLQHVDKPESEHYVQHVTERLSPILIKENMR